MTFRSLEGLPTYGEPPEAFPAGFGRLGREGFVVEFNPRSGTAWIGNFGPGLSSFSGAYAFPDGTRVFVVAGGAGYVVDPLARRVDGEVGGGIVGVWELTNPLSLLLNHQNIF